MHNDKIFALESLLLSTADICHIIEIAFVLRFVWFLHSTFPSNYNRIVLNTHIIQSFILLHAGMQKSCSDQPPLHVNVAHECLHINWKLNLKQKLVWFPFGLWALRDYWCCCCYYCCQHVQCSTDNIHNLVYVLYSLSNILPSEPVVEMFIAKFIRQYISPTHNNNDTI